MSVPDSGSSDNDQRDRLLYVAGITVGIGLILLRGAALVAAWRIGTDNSAVWAAVSANVLLTLLTAALTTGVVVGCLVTILWMIEEVRTTPFPTL